jgi:hypothetical protein
MNETTNETNGNMSATWLGWAWVLPQVILGGLNWYAWVLVRGDMTPIQHSRAFTIGLFELVLLASGCLAWIVQTWRRQSIGIGLALAALAAHTGYLWWFLQSIDRLLPTTVTLWMLPQTELIFYQFSLMMPVVFLMLVRLARIRLRLSTPVDVGLSLAALVLVPAGAFILGSLLVRLGHAFTWHDGMQTILIASIVAGTAFILVAFLRLMIRLHDLIHRQSWSDWAIPLAAGLLAPLAGLALNATIPFPYDFQDVAVYGMAILNGAALLIPFRPGTRWAFPGWAARVVFYPFTVYFFLVFLPFLPLSLLAMIAAGAGFLILAPLFLFIVHSRRLWEQGSVLAVSCGAIRLAAVFAACVLVLPAAFLLRNELDRRTLNQAVDAVFSPDYAAIRVPVRAASLRRALDRMDDVKHGIYLPYLSDLYNATVFHGMVLPDEKAALIRQLLLGQARPEKGRFGLWGNGFLGGRRPGNPRLRGNTATHQVALASHDEERRQANGITETEVRFNLENRGLENGEYSERIAVPEGVLVTGFWLDVNGTNKPAQLRERKAATWVYEMIRDMTRRDPGLLVYEDDRHLRLRVYPFAAGEKRRCGLRFRFPSALQPSIKVADVSISLTDPVSESSSPGAVSVTLAEGETALAIPPAAMANWTSFRREVVAHLILDQSACAGTNRAAVVARARSALAALPSSVNKVRITWANYEQEDMPEEPMSPEEALLALERVPSLPYRGGFCADRVMTRVLLAESRAPRHPQAAGYAPLFVVIPAPGSTNIQAGSLAPFARLAPDLPAYAVFNGLVLSVTPFDPVAGAVQSRDFSPTEVVLIGEGTNSTLVAANQDTLVFTPASGQLDKREGFSPCSDPAYSAGLSLWSRHRELAWTPGKVDAALPDLVKDARSAGVLIPEAAFIVVETQSQEVMVARKERQSLGANHALEFDEVSTNNQKAPAPPVVWLILPVLWLLWRRKAERIGA